MWYKGGSIRRLKIGVKYCGGCGAKYDRVVVVDRMKKALADFWEFVSWEDASADHILIVAGCETACVEASEFEGKTVHWLKSDESLDPTIDALKKYTL